MMRRGFYILLLVLVSEISFAQDPSFTQFFNTPSYYNPANASHYAEISANMAYRNQWSKLPGKFGTDYMSLVYSFCKGNGFRGIGLSAISDREGLNWLTTHSIGISPVFGVSGQQKNSQPIFGYSSFSFSLNCSVAPFLTQKSINWNSLLFSDQLDEVKGPVLPTALVIDGKDRKKLMVDLVWGLTAKLELINSNPFDVHPSLLTGFAVHHANKPDQSFTGVESKLPAKSVFHLLVNIPFSWYFLSPGFILERQKEYRTMLLGSSMEAQDFSLGIWYRSFMNSDALAFSGTINLRSGRNSKSVIKIGYSYDWTISGLKYSTFGSHELVLQYKFLKSCGKRHLQNGDCPLEFQRFRTKLTYNYDGWK